MVVECWPVGIINFSVRPRIHMAMAVRFVGVTHAVGGAIKEITSTSTQCTIPEGIALPLLVGPGTPWRLDAKLTLQASYPDLILEKR